MSGRKHHRLSRAVAGLLLERDRLELKAAGAVLSALEGRRGRSGSARPTARRRVRRRPSR